MKTFLVVKVLDVNYNPHKATLVDVLFVGTGPNAGRHSMKPVGPTGVFEIEIPDDVDEIQIGIDEPGFFPIGQSLRIKRNGPTPTLAFTNIGQEVNCRNLDGHARGGGDFNLEAFFVLGQLQDAHDSIEALKIRFPANGSGRKIFTSDPVPRPVIDFTGLTVLNSSISEKWQRLIHNPIPSVAPKGKMFYAERTTVPKLVGIWVPEGATVTRERDKVNPGQVPLNFHLFYHPSPGVLSGFYPFDFAFVDLIIRYMIYWKFLHKAMINQHQAAGSKSLLIFPVGDPAQWNGNFGSQTSILRLLQEVAYFVQRRQKIAFPLQPVGRCAVSGFSAGGQYVVSALGGDDRFFHDNVLAEIYGFDIRMDVSDFASKLSAWWRGGKDRRAFRIYTTVPEHFNALEGIDRAAGLFIGAEGAKERQGPQTNLVLMPVAGFWTGLHPESPPNPDLYQKFNANFDDVHQMFPALFLEHATKHSTL